MGPPPTAKRFSPINDRFTRAGHLAVNRPLIVPIVTPEWEDCNGYPAQQSHGCHELHGAPTDAPPDACVAGAPDEGPDALPPFSCDISWAARRPSSASCALRRLNRQTLPWLASDANGRTFGGCPPIGFPRRACQQVRTPARSCLTRRLGSAQSDHSRNVQRFCLALRPPFVASEPVRQPRVGNASPGRAGGPPYGLGRSRSCGRHFVGCYAQLGLRSTHVQRLHHRVVRRPTARSREGFDTSRAAPGRGSRGRDRRSAHTGRNPG